ncbi:MAG: AMP-binding protein [Planctomycetaceae bacterium]|jgi:acyl-CoA synthetase (AMP-forming)/AMP-acid ligase II|nr:AMP-binding protein [Planctomycetaceae bacterium]
MNLFDDIERFGDRVAVIDEESEILSYRDLIVLSTKIASLISPRSFVFVLGQNHPACVAAYVGFMRRKIVPLLLSNSIAADQLSRLIDIYSPAYIFAQQERSNEFLCDYELVGEFSGYVLLRRVDENEIKLHDDLGLVLTTSGSTGSPRLVRLSYKNILSNTKSIVKYLNIASDDRAITTMPMTYSYGLSIINTHLFVGGSVILTELTLMERGFWNLMKEHKPCTFGGVPYIFEMLKRLRFARMELSFIRYITQAGGRLSGELVSEFRDICADKGIKLIVMYGQTEATARMSYLPFERTYDKTESIGIAIPDGEFWLEDDAGKKIEMSNTSGELVYQGDNVSMGYAENIFDLNKPDENCGVLRTGDIAQRDDDGYYYIVGRKKRFLKIFGNRVNLDEVDQLLKRAGYDAVATGKDDQLIIFVTQNQIDKIKSLLVDQLKLNPVAFDIRFIPEIPRNESGKILYSKLNENIKS